MKDSLENFPALYSYHRGLTILFTRETILTMELAPLVKEHFPSVGATRKGKNLLSDSKLFPITAAPSEKGDKYFQIRVLSLGGVSIYIRIV